MGFFPSTNSIFAHLPHKIDVLNGSSRVVSILYIGLPASGMYDALGVQGSSTDPAFRSSASIERPSIKRMIPPIDNGAEIDIAKTVPS